MAPYSWSLFPENKQTRRSILGLCICFNVALTLLLLSRLQQTEGPAVQKPRPTRVPGIKDVLVDDPSPFTAHTSPGSSQSYNENSGPSEVYYGGGVPGEKGKDSNKGNGKGIPSQKGQPQPQKDHDHAMTFDHLGEDVLPEAMLGEKVAVVIESRLTTNLIPILLHFSSVLGPSWEVVLFTMESEWKMPSSIPFRRALEDQRIRVKYLPKDTDFGSHGAVSEFFATPWLWEQLETAYRVLVFQTDSIICANFNSTIEDFLKYDFIGAPVKQDFGRGFNGGLSLRNPKLMLSITTDKTFSFHEDSQKGKTELMFEDQWFYTKLSERGDALLPSEEIAQTFAVETIYYAAPLGYHQPQRWQPEMMEEIQKYCPEVGMLTEQRY